MASRSSCAWCCDERQAIVKSIVRAHEGTLVLAARSGGGLRVTVELPAEPGQAAG